MRRVIGGVGAMIAVSLLGVAAYFGYQSMRSTHSLEHKTPLSVESALSAEDSNAEGDHFKEKNRISKRALKRLISRAELADDLAHYQLAVLYEVGVDNLPADEEKARHHYQYLADRGYARAQFRLGYLYSKLGEREKTYELYQQAADQGYDLAQHNIAYFYENDSQYQDYQKAALYYQLAADQGLIPSINNLAGLYLRGLGVSQDIERALGLYQISFARHPNQTALNNLALISDQMGRYAEAIEYHTLLADEGRTHSQLRLGVLYLQGDPDVERSDQVREAEYQKAHHYLTLAAEGGSAEAHIQLGNIYAAGLGVEADGQYALYHFRMAVDGGNSFGHLGLAQLYGSSNLIPTNPQLALQHLISAHEMGNAQADYLLGIEYLQGVEGEEPDLERAEFYLRRAATQSAMPGIQQAALQFFERVESP